MVDSHADVVEAEDEPDVARVELLHKTQISIVEAVDKRPDHPNEHGRILSNMEMPHYGMVFKYWVEKTKPIVIMNNGPYDSKDHIGYVTTTRSHFYRHAVTF